MHQAGGNFPEDPHPKKGITNVLFFQLRRALENTPKKDRRNQADPLRKRAQKFALKKRKN